MYGLSCKSVTCYPLWRVGLGMLDTFHEVFWVLVLVFQDAAWLVRPLPQRIHFVLIDKMIASCRL